MAGAELQQGTEAAPGESISLIPWDTCPYLYAASVTLRKETGTDDHQRTLFQGAS